MAIIGNRILHPDLSRSSTTFRPAALCPVRNPLRVRAAGVAYVIVLLGINDIGHPVGGPPVSENRVSCPKRSRPGLSQLVERPRPWIRFFGSTLTPFETRRWPTSFSPEKDVKRRRVKPMEIRTAGRVRRRDRLRSARDPESGPPVAYSSGVRRRRSPAP